MRRLLPLIALLAFVSVYANQQRVKISPGFFTGKDYLDMSDTEKRAYVTGEINGMLVAPFFGAPEENLNWLKTCTGKMSDEELESIATSFPGVSQAFAIQAGREVRVLASSKDTDDERAAKICRDIARAFEEKLTFPGEIKVTVVRESRFVDVAK